MFSNRTPLFAAIFWVATVLSAPSLAQETDVRLPVPGMEEQAKSEKTIKELFKKEYLKRKPADLLALSVKLRRQATETKDDPVGRFVLYREARDLALSAGAVSQAIDIISETAMAFRIKRSETIASSLEKALTLPASASLANAIFDACSDLFDESAKKEEFAEVSRLIKIAQGASQMAQNISFTSAVNERIRDIEAIQRDHEKASLALEALSKEPRDPSASFALGRFLAFRQGDWAKGCMHLEHSDDADLKKLAASETAAPTESADQLALAEAWIAYAAKLQDEEKTAAVLRALYWLRQARQKATGLTKARVDKSVTALPRQYLIDMDEFGVSGLHFLKGKSDANTTIMVKGKPYPLGLFTHPPANSDCIVKYRLAKSARTFHADVAIGDCPGAVSLLTFSVVGDKKVLWTSRPMSATRSLQYCRINVAGVDILELRVHCAGSSNWAHAVWIDPFVTR